MWKYLFGDRKLQILGALAIIIKVLSYRKPWIEQYYTYGFYPVISRFLRFILGWIPFSIGDLLYLTAFIYLLYIIGRFSVLIKKRELRKVVSWLTVKRVLFLFISIYIVFNVFWGMNYDRLGIASQLQLDVQKYSKDDLIRLATVLQTRLNDCANTVDTSDRMKLEDNQVLFWDGVLAYKHVKSKYAFLTYNNPSIKPSMYSHIGHYFGFTGYYNPFSGEAQLKTTVPVFIKPFIVTHEIAHQLGYGKENEANFVGFLACRNADDINFRYSAYFELTLYTLSELRSRDTLAVSRFKNAWLPRVRNDYRSYLDYLLRTQNPIEPIIMRFYDGFLKMNNQPKGKETYNEVVAWLIAYMKRYGEEAI